MRIIQCIFAGREFQIVGRISADLCCVKVNEDAKIEDPFVVISDKKTTDIFFRFSQVENSKLLGEFQQTRVVSK